MRCGEEVVHGCVAEARRLGNCPNTRKASTKMEGVKLGDEVSETTWWNTRHRELGQRDAPPHVNGRKEASADELSQVSASVVQRGSSSFGVRPCSDASMTVHLPTATPDASRSALTTEPPDGLAGPPIETGHKMTSTTFALTLIIAGILTALAMIIRFLTHVYDCGGPKHVLDVARGLRQVYDPNWPSKLLGYLPANGDEDGGDTAPAPRRPGASRRERHGLVESRRRSTGTSPHASAAPSGDRGDEWDQTANAGAILRDRPGDVPGQAGGSGGI